MRPFEIFATLALTIRVSSAGASAEAATYRRVANVRPGHVAWIDREPDTASPQVGCLKAGALRVRTMGCERLAIGGCCHVMRRGTRGRVQDRFFEAGEVMWG